MQSNQPISLNRNNSSSLDRIKAYYLEQTALSDKDLAICRRLEQTYSILTTEKVKAVTVKKLEALHKKAGKPLTRPQIYLDIRQAKEVFSNIEDHNKAFLRSMIIEDALEEIMECKELIASLKKDAKDNKDQISVAQWQKIKDVMNNAYRRITETGGLNKEDSKAIDPSKFQPHSFTINLPEETIKLLEQASKTGVVDVTDFLDKNAQPTNIIDDSES